MNFCSSLSSCAFPSTSVQQREIIGLDGKIRRAEQGDSAEGERLCRAGWKPAVETEVTLGVQWALRTQVVKVLTFPVWEIGPLVGLLCKSNGVRKEL